MGGAKHQFFVIARVKPHSKNGEEQEPRYRCVAALHHQWLWSTMVISPVLLFMELCRNPYNARAIEAELASIAGRYGPYGREEPVIDRTPCPHLSQMLCISIYKHSGPMVPYTSNRISAGQGSLDYPHDEGITIFDVTDPKNCRYCHMILKNKSTKPNPISSQEYLKSYKDEPSDEETKAFEKLPLIPPEVLVEAWPWEYTMAEDSKEKTASCDDDETEERSIIPPLSSMSHERLLPFLLAKNQIDSLPDVVLDDSMKYLERRHLLTCPKIQGADLALLHHVLLRDANKNEDLLDLSGLNLTVEDITNLDIDKRKIRYMDLSSSSTFSPTTEDLVKLGTRFPLLECLNLLHCSNVDADNLKEYFARNGATYQIIHPMLITFDQRLDEWGYKPTPVYGSQFAVIIHTYDSSSRATKTAKNRWIGASVRYFNLAPALQVVHDVVSRFARRKAPIIDQTDLSSIEFTSYLTSGSHLSKSTWAERPFLGLADKVLKFKADDRYRFEVGLMIPKDFTAWTFILHEDYIPYDRTRAQDDQPQPNLEYSFVRFEDCKAVELCDLNGFLQRNRPLEGAMMQQLVNNLDQALSKSGPLPTLEAHDRRPKDSYTIQRTISVLSESAPQGIAEELFTTKLDEEEDEFSRMPSLIRGTFSRPR